MANTISRGIRLFKIWGITVYLHWTWFLAVPLALTYGKEVFQSTTWQIWSIAAYLLLFAIVLLHEFGHALACRSVGGKAERILLWPLGGLAYVQPPPRPGALLWSIAAGPLVNVALLILSVPVMLALPTLHGDLHQFVYYAIAINAGLLIFNLIPIYPLDGGQLLRIRAKAIRHIGFACPMCHAAPPAGPYWKCSCGHLFDTFETGAVCPGCGKSFGSTACLDCGAQSPLSKWQIPWPLPPLAGEPIAATSAARAGSLF
jgi:hypothetical protein